ncbi:O-antigen ligase family protein [Patescibacteria group bacterium]|nr:O-antigen ligase family protein [Patescibacteria group bacterium]
MEILIALFLIAFFFLSWRRLETGLFFIAALLPTYLIRFQILGLPLTLLESMILIVFAIWFFKEWPELKKRLRFILARFRKGENKKSEDEKTNYPFWREIIFLLIISFISLAVADFSLAALGIWKAYFLEPILLFIVAVNVLSTNKKREQIFLALALSVLSISLVAVYQKLSGQFIANDFWAASESRRVVSWFSYPNAVGLFLAPLVLLFSGFFYSLPRLTTLSGAFKKIGILVVIILGALSIFFARSDGGLVAVLVAIFVFAFLADRKKRIIALSLAGIFLIFAFVYAPLGESLVNHLGFKNLSGQIRLQQWEETMETLKGPAFLLGNGLSGYQEAVKPYHQEGIFFNYDGLENFDAVVWASSTLREKYWQPVEIYLYPHNIFLNFWTELGLIGALLFLFILIKASIFAFKLFKHYKRENNLHRYLALGLLGALIAIFVHGLVDVPYFKNDLAALFFLLLAILGTMKIESERK